MKRDLKFRCDFQNAILQRAIMRIYYIIFIFYYTRKKTEYCYGGTRGRGQSLMYARVKESRKK